MLIQVSVTLKGVFAKIENHDYNQGGFFPNVPALHKYCKCDISKNGCSTFCD